MKIDAFINTTFWSVMQSFLLFIKDNKGEQISDICDDIMIKIPEDMLDLLTKLAEEGKENGLSFDILEWTNQECHYCKEEASGYMSNIMIALDQLLERCTEKNIINNKTYNITPFFSLLFRTNTAMIHNNVFCSFC